MDGIIGIIILSLVLFFLLIKHLILKKQIKNISRQLDLLSQGKTEKMLDISLIDRDLEKLAGTLNRYYDRQRYSVACALQHEEHLKESIANISHDLRTPLTVIIGHLQMLEKTDLSGEQIRRIETALHKAIKMKDLISAFYDLSIIDSDHTEPQEEDINLTNMLIDFLTESAPLFERKHIQPEIILPDASVFIYSDRNMVERILQNLLTNAVRYSSGKIQIRLCRSEESRVTLYMDNSVQDVGKFDVDRLFERFYTGDSSRHGESTGLGLAIVKILVEKIGGSISASVESDILSIQLIF